MSAATETPRAGEPAASPAATKIKRPNSSRLAKLLVHVGNVYRLMIKELRGIRSDPIMPVAAFPEGSRLESPTRLTDQFRRHRRNRFCASRC